MRIDRVTGNQIPQSVQNNDIQQQIEEERKEEEARSRATPSPEPFPTAPTEKSVIGVGDKNAIYNNIVQMYKKEQQKHNKQRKITRKMSKSL